mmetsp:Transcript_1800/g.4988  ORF Transcript_1800/g.4988 Transcript_1800/m.4988 type:complete len:294 (+) Transcript_1800:1295-2176(+)
MSIPSTIGLPPMMVLRRCGFKADSCNFRGPCVRRPSMDPDTSTRRTAFPVGHSKAGTLFLAASDTAVSNASRYLFRSSTVGGLVHTRLFFSTFLASLPLPYAFSVSMNSCPLAASSARVCSVCSSKSIASNADRNFTGICLEFAICFGDFKRPMTFSCVSVLTPARMRFRKFFNMAMKGKLPVFTKSSQTCGVLPFSESSVSHVFGTSTRNLDPTRDSSKVFPFWSSPMSLNSSSFIGYCLRRIPHTSSFFPDPACTCRIKVFIVKGRFIGSFNASSRTNFCFCASSWAFSSG